MLTDVGRLVHEYDQVRPGVVEARIAVRRTWLKYCMVNCRSALTAAIADWRSVATGIDGSAGAFDCGGGFFGLILQTGAPINYTFPNSLTLVAICTLEKLTTPKISNCQFSALKPLSMRKIPPDRVISLHVTSCIVPSSFSSAGIRVHLDDCALVRLQRIPARIVRRRFVRAFIDRRRIRWHGKKWPDGGVAALALLLVDLAHVVVRHDRWRWVLEVVVEDLAVLYDHSETAPRVDLEIDHILIAWSRHVVKAYSVSAGLRPYSE